MEIIGIRFRKISVEDNRVIKNPNRENLRKQIRTLFRKISRNEEVLYMKPVIERDSGKKSMFHVHATLHYTDDKNLFYQLSRFVGGSIWKDNKDPLEPAIECNGAYGEVAVHPVSCERGFDNYKEKKWIMEEPLFKKKLT